MNEPDFNLLLALDALLSEASVAGAARRLGLSASAMSRTLTRLRTATGDPLLVRAGRRMVLTPHAQAIRQRANSATMEARSVLTPAVSALTLPALERTFTLRTNEGFIETFGPRLISAVAAVAPGVCLCFVPKAEKDAAPLREGRVDLEIGVLSGMGPEIRLQALFRDRFVGVVRQGHPLLQTGEASADRYAAYGHVVSSRHGKAQGPVDSALAEHGLQRKIAAIVPGYSAAMSVVQHSDLIAQVPASWFASQQMRFGEVIFQGFALPVDTPPITVSQMWHPRMEVDPAHRWLRQQVLSVCQTPEPESFSLR
ncbi:LysR family transcriptional regulator [Kluyvera cryocrescens]|uniref:LysR family transcriptional regulator n=1 Tax=Kluyvera cryocrescens TaxID=580 RepID=UPI0039F64CBB